MLLNWFDVLSRMLCLALHVVSAGSFPKPLTLKEEQKYLEQFRKKGDLSARNCLVEHNLRLVAHIIKKYYRANYDQEDLISIGTIGLIKAVESFDYQKGTRLATYASRCIENEILMYFRSEKKTAHDVSFSEPIDVDKEGHPLTLMDVIAGEDTIAEDLDLKVNTEKLYRYMQECLEEREREILEWRYGMRGDGLTQREVSQKFNISRSYVSRIEKKALEKLRRRFESGDTTELHIFPS